MRLFFSSLVSGVVGVAILAAAALPAAAEVTVWIDSPMDGDYAYGMTEIAAGAQSDEPIRRVTFYVDGELIGTLTEPPYTLAVNLGYENKSHRFEVVAYTQSGDSGRAVIDTAMVTVDEEIDLSLHQLYVTVGRGDNRVTDLERADFRVRDDGDDQQIVTFEQGDVPLTAVLLLDCSESMVGGRMEGALAGAGVFLERMADLDEAAVVLFSDHLVRATEFSRDLEVLRGALSEVTPAGGTALNDHLFMGLQRLEARQGRRIAVLFSDGKDVHSALPMAQVLEKARTSPALIYWIYLTDRKDDPDPDFYSSWRRKQENGEEFRLLEQAVEESGGRVEQVTDPSQLEEAFAGILAELRDQYVLGYYPSNRRGDGSWRAIKVTVEGAGARARTRAGYFDH